MEACGNVNNARVAIARELASYRVNPGTAVLDCPVERGSAV
jgi:hypothetical protein